MIKGDLLDKSVYDKIGCEIDFTFHLAAQAGVRYSIANAAEVANNNIVSTVNVFEYALHNNGTTPSVRCHDCNLVFGVPFCLVKHFAHVFFFIKTLFLFKL